MVRVSKHQKGDLDKIFNDLKQHGCSIERQAEKSVGRKANYLQSANINWNDHNYGIEKDKKERRDGVSPSY